MGKDQSWEDDLHLDEIDLNDPHLEEDSIPPPPLLPTLEYIMRPSTARRDTLRMSKRDIQEAVGPGLSEDDLAGYDSDPPPPV